MDSGSDKKIGTVGCVWNPVTGSPIHVVTAPTREQMRELAEANTADIPGMTEPGHVRAVVSCGVLYAWRGDEAIHHHAVEALNLGGVTDTHRLDFKYDAETGVEGFVNPHAAMWEEAMAIGLFPAHGKTGTLLTPRRETR